MSTPQVYLSTSGGTWRLIYKEQPLCANTSRERAESVARHYGHKPETLPVWNGDRGEFETANG